MEQRRWAEAEPSAAQLLELYEGWGKAEKAAVFRGRAGMR
jgi:hypothetical protein